MRSADCMLSMHAFFVEKDGNCSFPYRFRVQQTIACGNKLCIAIFARNGLDCILGLDGQ